MISSPNLLRYDRVYGEVLDSCFSTDQSSQFTNLEFTTRLNDTGIQISMDRTGCWRDNEFVERLWRSVKYEEVYLHAHGGVSAAQRRLVRRLRFYNHRRPLRGLDVRAPEDQTLVCPSCSGTSTDESEHFVCRSCRRRSSTQEGIPRFLSPLSQDELQVSRG